MEVIIMIKQAGIDDSKIVAELAILLWPDNEINNLEKEMINYIISDNGAVFIYIHFIYNNIHFLYNEVT